MRFSLVLCATAGCWWGRADLALHFDHRIGDEGLALATDYATRYGQTVAFDHLRYWVSNVEVGHGGQGYRVPESYYLVEQTPEGARTTIELSVPSGRYDTIAFHIGVDPAPNHSLDLMAGELEPGIGMDWSWDTGYKFFRAEGRFAAGGVAGRFAVHAGNDVLYKRIAANLGESISLPGGRRTEITLRADLGRLFAGIELDKTSEILGGPVDSPAGKIAGNYSRMFTLVTADESVPMTSTSPNLETSPNAGDIPGDATPPLLTHAVIDLGRLFCAEVPARPVAERRACMTPFVRGSKAAYQDAGFFTFVTENGAAVYAAAPGIVSEVLFLEHSPLTHSDLYWVTVRPNQDSAFFLDYRHLKDLQVRLGQRVEAGQRIGGAGDYFAAGVGIVSFGVRREQELLQRLCPTRFTAPGQETPYQQALATSNAAWPELARTELCEAPSLVCSNAQRCASAADFSIALGDVDGGRRVYRSDCASCHGASGEGNIGPPLCPGPSCGCRSCIDHGTLATRIERDMPPEGYCDLRCATDVAAYIFFALARQTSALFAPNQAIPAPEHNPTSDAGVALGKRLFFDQRLSGTNRISCATCHQPARAFSDGRLRSRGSSGAVLPRHTPALVNLAWMNSYSWDGGGKNLESQVFGPLTSRDEMAQDGDELLIELASDRWYPAMFARAFGDGITLANVARALAQYERTLIAADSRYDRYLRGDPGGHLDRREVRGAALFARHCGACHVPGLFTDNAFHNNGLDSTFPSDNERIAWGRGRISGKTTDIGKYRTPTLRNVAVTAPYMHDGRFASLEAVLEHYRFAIRGSPTLDPLFINDDESLGIHMSDGEAAAIIAFLHTLTNGDQVPIDGNAQGDDRAGAEK